MTPNSPRPRGRPALPRSKKRVARTIKLTPAEDEAHKRAAERAGLTVTEWRRTVLARAAAYYLP